MRNRQGYTAENLNIEERRVSSNNSQKCRPDNYSGQTGLSCCTEEHSWNLSTARSETEPLLRGPTPELMKIANVRDLKMALVLIAPSPERWRHASFLTNHPGVYKMLIYELELTNLHDEKL